MLNEGLLPQQCIHASQDADWLPVLQAALMSDHCTLVSLQRIAQQIMARNAEKLLEVGLEDTQVQTPADSTADERQPLPLPVNDHFADA